MKNPLVLGEHLSVTVDRLAFEGMGVARYQNIVVFVLSGVPDEMNLIEITQVKKSYAIGKILEVIKPSKHRVIARCDYFNSCGGCPWQHISYSEQLRQKQEILETTFKPEFKLCVHPIQESSEIFGYRNRIRLKCENSQLGYYRSGSHHFVPIDRCLIAKDKINSKWKTLLQISIDQPHLNEIEVLEDKQKEIIIETDKKKFRFTQVNDFIDKKIKDTLVSKLHGLTPKRVFDFYCGDGNFSFVFSKIFPKSQIFGVEANCFALQRAQKMNSFENLIFYSDTVEKFLKKLTSLEDALVFIDPPRSGLPEYAIKKIIELDPKFFFYLSCNPQTLKRDCKRLDSKFQLSEIFPFDMFPHTSHIELLCCFKKH